MRINLHIERLVIEGLPLEQAHASLVQSAVQQELAQLLGSKGIAPALMTGGAMSQAQGSNLRVGRESSPRQLGTQIANSVHEGLVK